AEAGPIGPAPAREGGPEILIGAFKPKAQARVARWGDGLLAAAPPSWAGGLFDTVRRDWQELGRKGEPRLVAQVNVALGPDSLVDEAKKAMYAYYEFTGMAEQMVSGMLTAAADIRSAIRAYRDLGADEVMLYCYGGDPDQVDRLADLA
ncbi:LLM class flavin-dependent oxidoreductase, partial [Amycolatopsis sp. NPDC000673]|uniref:LLM class flavin-dependent oxidoreductase n=1 Tax=Amycolatopsis sp. NPDC000673 TaxID=3154267 RepID=UPI0033217996